jgi:thiol-disulfide isomerase/thioredoxin
MRHVSTTLFGIALVTLGVGASATAARADSPAQALDGRWDATVTIKDAVIPFRLDVATKGGTVTGTLFNGDQTQTTTNATVGKDGTVTLEFAHYLTTIKAKATPDNNGELEGTVEGRFERERYIAAYPFHATRYVPRAAAVAGAGSGQQANVPDIAGVWEIPYDSPKGEKAWRFVVKQQGAEVSAAILRVDGDTGALTGSYREQDAKFILSHFDGARPLVFEVTPTKENTLQIHQNGAYTTASNLVAYRPADARAKGLPEPANFTTHTTVRDANEKFAFNFPDVNGKQVSSEDPQFKGKVTVAIVTGTWCPNCHDEAQYLVQLYKQYHDKGLEIVALDFEEPEQQDDLTRVHAFVKKYGVPYPYLIAGAPTEMWEKVPQGVNLNTWPATFFIGKDGRVKSIHAGFAAPASGQFHEQLKGEFTSTIERLLAEPAPPVATPVTSSAAR